MWQLILQWKWVVFAAKPVRCYVQGTGAVGSCSCSCHMPVTDLQSNSTPEFLPTLGPFRATSHRKRTSTATAEPGGWSAAHGWHQEWALQVTKHSFRVGPLKVDIPDPRFARASPPCSKLQRKGWKVITVHPLLFLSQCKGFRQVRFGSIKQVIRLDSLLETAYCIVPTALRDKHKPQVVVGWCISGTNFQRPG